MRVCKKYIEVLINYIGTLKMEIRDIISVSTLYTKESKIMDFLVDNLWYIAITILGIVALVMPYDKWENLFPKAPPKAVTKICAVVVVVCGIALIAMSMGFV